MRPSILSATRMVRSSPRRAPVRRSVARPAIVTLTLASALAGSTLHLGTAPVLASGSAATTTRVVVSPAFAHDESPPLRSIPPVTAPARTAGLPRSNARNRSRGGALTLDALSGLAVVTPAIPATSTSFDGTPVTSCGGHAWEPPDPAAAAGTGNEIMEIVNDDIAVYSKSGATLLAPECTGTLWSGFSNGCQGTSNGDGTVVWDSLALRWVVSIPSSGSTPPLQCVAVSATTDALGNWYRYAFTYRSGADYPKLGVWGDGYYVTGNTGSDGPVVCAYDRFSMLNGASASEQCVYTGSSWSALPATVDGTVPPPPGEPEWILNIGSGVSLNYWRFAVNWTEPLLTTMVGPLSLSVNAFTEACGGGFGSCAKQPGTTQQLETLSDRLMYRLAYRNFGAYESLVVNHTVASGDTAGPKWYELRVVGGTALVDYQEGIQHFSGAYRFMGSMAEDKLGDIALGYTVSGSTTYPSVAYAGRLATDAPNTMAQGEGIIQAGSASQTGTDRWGDYTEMTVDPNDDCTFWYVNQYQTATGDYVWHTRIGSFSFPTCTLVP